MSEKQKTTWNVDRTHSEINFQVNHMRLSMMSGHFKEFSASVETDNEAFLNATFKFSAKTYSINTRNNKRDSHLRSDDFFKVNAFPEMIFMSTFFDGNTMKGNLTIRDVTREIELDVDFNGIAIDPYGRTKAGFEISGEINRKDFNLTWNTVTESGNIVVGDVVTLVVGLQFTKT